MFLYIAFQKLHNKIFAKAEIQYCNLTANSSINLSIFQLFGIYPELYELWSRMNYNEQV